MVELSLCHGDALSHLDWRPLVFVGYFMTVTTAADIEPSLGTSTV